MHSALPSAELLPPPPSALRLRRLSSRLRLRGPKPASCSNPSTLFGLVCSQYSCCQSFGNRMCVLRYDQDIRPLSHLFRKMVGWWGPWNSEYIKTHWCQVWCLAGWPLFVMYFQKHRLGLKLSEISAIITQSTVGPEAHKDNPILWIITYSIIPKSHLRLHTYTC